ncbi:MAG: acetolactate synthase small subunit [Nitrososphaerales archaeon]|nr:acetolactate synthase small subunit [Nitrososphaerales archaeon]
MNKMRIISTIVENKPGVLYKVSNMFRARGFNIDSITVGTTEKTDLSRMTIVINADEPTLKQLVKQLAKLIDVVHVDVIDPQNAIYRELALIKLNAIETKSRLEIISYANVFDSKVVDVSTEHVTVEITGTPEKIDAFIKIISPFGIKELARTGVTALTRG